jgi:hypothetical protein
MQSWGQMATAAATLLPMLASISATAHVVVTTNQRAGWFTVGEVAGTGQVGDTVEVTFSDGSKKQTTVLASGKWSIGLTENEPSGTASVTDSSGETASITVAQGFTPPNNQVKTTFAVLTGSALSIGGQSFALNGNFTTLDTDVDYNSASPSFGKLAGSVLASSFDVSGTGAPGTAKIGFASDQPYTVDMLPLWNAPTLTGGVAIPFDMSLSGSLDLNGMTGAFAGTVSGTDTFFPDATENIDLSINLNSDFGAITGIFLAHGSEELVVPEPSGWAVILAGGAGLAVFARRRRSLAE